MSANSGRRRAGAQPPLAAERPRRYRQDMLDATVRLSLSSSPDIALVESFFEAFHAKDLDRALAMMSDDVVYQNVPFPSDRGKPAVARTLRAFGRVMTGFEARMKNIAARDGVVLTERVDILTGPLVHLEIWVCGTFEIRNGRITLWRDYFDLATAATQLVTGPVRKLFGRARSV